MNRGKAFAIFLNLDSSQYSNDEKATAIHIVAELKTHNGFSKDKMLDAIKRLIEQNYEVKNA